MSRSLLGLVLRVEGQVLNEPENLNGERVTESLEDVLASKPRKVLRYDDIDLYQFI